MQDKEYDILFLIIFKKLNSKSYQKSFLVHLIFHIITESEILLKYYYYLYYQ
jgi:hypothetical protein